MATVTHNYDANRTIILLTLSKVLHKYRIVSVGGITAPCLTLFLIIENDTPGALIIVANCDWIVYSVLMISLITEHH